MYKTLSFDFHANRKQRARASKIDRRLECLLSADDESVVQWRCGSKLAEDIETPQVPMRNHRAPSHGHR